MTEPIVGGTDQPTPEAKAAEAARKLDDMKRHAREGVRYLELAARFFESAKVNAVEPTASALEAAKIQTSGILSTVQPLVA